MAVRSELYRCRPPARLKVLILVQTEVVKNDVPMEADIKLAVQGLKGGRAGSLSGMIAKDLEGWRKKAKREKDLERRRWELVVRLMQVMFRDGTVTEEISWEKLFLTPKGKGEYRGIGLV